MWVPLLSGAMSDALIPYHTAPKILINHFDYLLVCLKSAGWVANSVDYD